MATTLKDLLGEELVQYNQSDDKQFQIETNKLDGKNLAFYFSAHWCPPCRQFTPILANAYKNINNEIKTKLDIIFISWDENSQGFDEYLKEMPWKALPFSDRDRAKELGDKFEIQSIPRLIVLSSSFEIITLNGIEEISIGSEEALIKWSEGKSLCWSREAKENEYVWENGICSSCYMKPLIGSRYKCINKQCQINLCKSCLTKTKHEHQLVEYLIPNQKYTLEQIISSIPDLLPSNNAGNILMKAIFENDIKPTSTNRSRCIPFCGLRIPRKKKVVTPIVKSMGFYFSAHWCPPCQEFTPMLAEFYKETREKYQSFDIVFLSFDQDEDSFNTYRSQMPWPAVPFNLTDIFAEYFKLQGLPSLIVVSSDGQILSRKGCEDVEQHGIRALQTWSRAEKLTPPPPDQYKWTHFACDGCGIKPIVGEKYSCLTCQNYDLCSACAKKGHEHELKLQLQQNDDDHQSK
ncbi:unnamed protein product [Adineta steineri]|uniref:protein-disulfide reductase n=1 Tax=Adineta steineri TaxID=433720 RepID=A0A819DEQ0_9BILA|nr:unnamed protein product [Adineta steineri]CAF3837044.1 unnamed protein product [Adineta steineri]